MKQPYDLPPEAADATPLADFWAKLITANGKELPCGEYEFEDALRDQVARGELVIWGREKSPVAPFREIPCTAGRLLQFLWAESGDAAIRGGPTFCDCWIGSPAARPLPPTGAPGRRSSMYLILVEHERRVIDGEASQVSRQHEAATLEQWLKIAHPTMPPTTAKTIKNNLPKTFQPSSGRLKAG